MGKLDFTVIRFSPKDAKRRLLPEEWTHESQSTLWQKVEVRHSKTLPNGAVDKVVHAVTYGTFYTSTSFRGIRGDGNELDVSVFQTIQKPIYGLFSSSDGRRRDLYSPRDSPFNIISFELNYPSSLNEKVCGSNGHLPIAYRETVVLPLDAMVQSIYTTYHNDDRLTDYVVTLNNGGAIVFQQSASSDLPECKVYSGDFGRGEEE